MDTVSFQPRPPPSSSPFGSATGSALDVIVVAPSSSSSSLRRQSASSAHAAPNDPFPNASINNSVPLPVKGGVAASSDFYVSFPSNLAWTTEGNDSSTRSASIRNKSLKSARSFRSIFYSKPSSNLSRSKTESSSTRTGRGGVVIEEEPGNFDEEGVEVGGDYGSSSDLGMSERGTSSTEANVPHSPLSEDQNSRYSPPQREQVQPQSRLTSSMSIQNNGQDNNNSYPIQQQRKGNVRIQINGRYIPQLDMIFSSKASTCCRFVHGNGLRPPTETLEMLMKSSEYHNNNNSNSEPTIQGAVLNYGRNLLRYTLYSKTGLIVATAESHLHLWRSYDSVIVADVDGTVTKSDVRGVIDTVIQDNFQYCHEGICKFFHDMVVDVDVHQSDKDEDYFGEEGEEVSLELGTIGQHQHQQLDREVSMGSTRKEEVGEVRFLYLSARPISLIGQTRKLLVSLKQTNPSNLNDRKGYGLPPGPIFHHTGPLSSVLYSELVAKNIHEFKADVLARQVVLPFVAARGEDWKKKTSPSCKSIKEEATDSVDIGSSRSWSGMSEASLCDDRLFLAGFGNKLTDAMAYEMAGIDRRDIYIIDKESRILCMGVNSNNQGGQTGVGNGKEQGGNNDEIEPNSSKLTNNMNISESNNGGGVFCDQPDWSQAEVCCPGVAEGQISSEFTSPVKVDTSSSNENKAASSIHSIELSFLADETQPNEDTGNLTISKTAVDIYVSNDRQKYSNGNAAKRSSSKGGKLKQSVRAFSSKKSFTTKNKFPSFGSASSNNASSKSGPAKKLYEGYGDPLLLDKVRDRMFG